MVANPPCIFEPEQYDLIREAGRLAGEVLHLSGERIKPGVTPLELDDFAEAWIREQGHIPTFKGYMGFPKTLCISINDEIVHGIPNEKPLKNGDIVSIDVGVTIREQFKNKDFDYVGDNAFTFICGETTSKVQKLLQHTNEGLWAGIDAIEAGATIKDISAAVEKVAREKRYGNIREFGGHGIGPNYHCEPFIPNFTDYFDHVPDSDIEPGMVLAIEPMFTTGSSKIKKHKDGWTILTADRKPAAHFEHSVLVTKDGIEIITNTRKTRDYFTTMTV